MSRQKFIQSKFFVAGGRGMVGSAIIRRLEAEGASNILAPTSQQLDLTNQSDVDAFFAEHRPEVVYLAAAKVGGIHANNTYPAEFIYQNLAIQTHTIHAAWKYGVKRLCFLGSSCIYPKEAPQPIREEYLLTGPLEPTNEPYAIAKIAGIKLCESYNRQYGTDFRCLMPTNLYGPGDNYHPENSHVIPALIRRFHEAKESGAKSVTIWGTGRPRREFLHVDDLAEASVHVMSIKKGEYESAAERTCSHVNVGTGSDLTIEDLAKTISRIVGYEGEIVFDSSRPDGALRKLLDIGLIKSFDWSYRITLESGLKDTYQALIHEVSDYSNDVTHSRSIR